MYGMILWQSPQSGLIRRNVCTGEELVFHLRFFCVRIVRGPRTAEAVIRRRVAAAAKVLRRAGVSKVVTPAGFSYAAQLQRHGLASVSTLALRRELAADLVQASLAERGISSGGARIAVAGDAPTGELARAVTELSLRSRYLLLDLPYGGEELCRQLRREYGVSIQLNPERELLLQSDVLVLFHPRTDLRGAAEVPLYEGAAAPLPDLTLPPALESQLPDGCDRPQLLSALREAGVLRPGQVTVKTGNPCRT